MSSEPPETDELTLEPFKEGDEKSTDPKEKFTGIKGKRIALIAGIAAFLVLVIFLFMYFGSSSDTKVTSTKQATISKQAPQKSFIYEMPDINTNLAPNNDKETWIKLGVTLQLETSKDQAALDKKLPMVKDAIIVFLREVRSSDLASSGGSLMLKSELLKRINKVMYPVKLRDVLLREILLDQ